MELRDPARKLLWQNVRWMVLILAVVAAAATPTPDAAATLKFMAPMVALYFLGIGVKVFAKGRKR